jgi:hypothetical protein
MNIYEHYLSTMLHTEDDNYTFQNFTNISEHGEYITFTCDVYLQEDMSRFGTENFNVTKDEYLKHTLKTNLTLF